MKTLDEQLFRKIFGSVVKRHRENRKMTQDELSAAAGLHRTYISDVERGARNLSMDSMLRIAKGLNLLVSMLFVEAEKDIGETADLINSPETLSEVK